MCDNCTDLNDDLSDLLNSPRKPTPIEPPPSYKPAEFIEDCPACHGRGVFVSWSGRVVGPCFKCKGKGKLSFKSSPQERAANKVARDAAKAEKARQLLEQIETWKLAEPEVWAWINDNRSSFEFAAAMYDALHKFGDLTEGQMNACRRCVEKQKARTAQRMAAAKAREDAAVAIDISKLETAFDKAKAKARESGAMGIKWLHLRLQSGEHSLSFSPGTPGSQWDGMIFVKEGDKKLGWIKNGKFTRRSECTDAEEAAILDACTDPLKAALAYGQRWSVCACCGRELTNKESIERGIGPICAETYGW